MITRKKTLALISGMLLLLLGTAAGQGAKTIKEKDIASCTVYEYFVEEGLDEPLIESFEGYNEQGDLLEIKEFNRKGEVKRWEKYVYDEKGKLVEEIFLDEKGRVESTERTMYADGIKVEKQYFNNRDKLYKRKVYEYEYRK